MWFLFIHSPPIDFVANGRDIFGDVPTPDKNTTESYCNSRTLPIAIAIVRSLAIVLQYQYIGNSTIGIGLVDATCQIAIQAISIQE